jgi:hypothetical protein
LAPFPAWGIVSISFILPATFLLLIGIDSATYYIGSDSSVRRFLYKYKNELELFQSLGSTEAYSIIERRIHNVSKQVSNHLETETIFKPAPESEDIKQYVKQVLDEMKEAHGKSDKRKSKDSSDNQYK